MAEEKAVRPAAKGSEKDRLEALDTAFDACDLEGTGEVSQKDLMEYTGKAKSTVQNWVDEHPGFLRENGIIRRVQRSKNDEN